MDNQHRVGLLDELRGAAIIAMVFYHGAYDLITIFNVNISFFFSPQMNTLRDIFAGLFILVSGIACRYSRSNLKRGAFTFGLGMLFTAFTALFMPQQLIVFGILHFLGISMMLFALTQKLLDRISPLTGIAAAVFLFVMTFRVSSGFIGLFPTPLPSVLYEIGFLFPFGFISSDFYSADYFALLPWLFVFLCGSYIGVYVKQNKLPAWFYRNHCKPLAFVGRHTIYVYVLHQPVVYGILSLLFMLIGR